ncbi:MAG: glutamine--fructose-6-phosphate transaminase (isomerizing) [Oscillospiraceae bacterium]|nr:glutamine--fructose-6-phosphate transaminase (isomerizing) [Oscillospiraceae bacterium]
MCGIVGYIGHEQAAPILLDGLKKLEYRGYDSAGVCVSDGGSLKVVKAKGRLQNLCDLLDDGKNITGCVGIGHTRWATHGAPSDQNSHPQLADSGKIAVVHNGIIENYAQLKERLIAAGKHFASETDTEVVANLIEYFYDQGFDFRMSVHKAVERIRGSYALGIMCRDYPDTIIAVKKDSPLIFGFGDGCNFIASDVPAVLRYTREVCYLEDGDMVMFTDHDVHFFDAAGDVIEKMPEHISWDAAAAEKGGYAHFMLKEIHEQPKAVRDTISPRIQDGKIVLDQLSLTEEFLRGLDRIYIVGCGSAYHVGVLGKYIIEKLCRIPVEPILASEFRYADPVLNEKALVVIISQSGETADTIAALREAKRLGTRTVAIVNVVGSTISKLADDVLYTWAGPEIAVATTKAYSTQLAVIDLLALYLAQTLHTLDEVRFCQLLRDLTQLPEKITEVLSPERIALLQHDAALYFNNRDVFYIGRNLDSASCLESSLKLKEISYIHSEAYAAGELKHGPISLIENGTLVVVLATNPALFEKTMSNVKEVKARGAHVLGVTIERLGPEMEKNADSVFLVPETDPLFEPSLSVVPMQTFAYYVALMRGCDVDKPRNLAKSVTVE